MSVFIDIREMHTKFDMHKFIKTATNREILQYLKFRVNFIEEEIGKHTSELQSHSDLVCRLLLEKKKKKKK